MEKIASLKETRCKKQQCRKGKGVARATFGERG